MLLFSLIQHTLLLGFRPSQASASRAGPSKQPATRRSGSCWLCWTWQINMVQQQTSMQQTGWHAGEGPGWCLESFGYNSAGMTVFNGKLCRASKKTLQPMSTISCTVHTTCKVARLACYEPIGLGIAKTRRIMHGRLCPSPVDGPAHVSFQAV